MISIHYPNLKQSVKCGVARQNARSVRVCLDLSLLLSLDQAKESKKQIVFLQSLKFDPPTQKSEAAENSLRNKKYSKKFCPLHK
jgi:hypothetical protein